MTLFINLAQANVHLKCLGREEANIHKIKMGGAYSKLNQWIIGDMIQLSDLIKLEKGLLKKVCDKNATFPSLDLLKCFLTKKQRCFTVDQKLSPRQKSINMATVKEIIHQAPYTLIKFINSLQSQMDKPNCLIKKIPGLEEFFYKTRYTQEDTGIQKLVREIKDIKGIFKKLQSPKIFNACLNPKKEKQ